MDKRKECVVDAGEFYKKLVSLRAERHGGFINDGGFRHIKNESDTSGFSYAFWLIKKTGEH